MLAFEGELANHNFSNLQFVLNDFCPQNHHLVCQILGQAIADSAPIGGVFEYAPKAHLFAKNLAEVLKKQGGVAINIDYGYSSYEFANTLQVLKNHQKQDFLTSCQNADITALVDFVLLQKVAKQHNLQYSLILQSEFLKQIGIYERAEILQKLHPTQATQIATDISRLTDVKQMGGLFKVLVWW